MSSKIEVSAVQHTRIIACLLEETGLAPYQVAGAIALLKEGATVPFIARYRKERTGELDELRVRELEERYGYFCELEERKNVILKSIAEQGKLTPELSGRIAEVRQKTELEDLYLPYKPKRRTKATIARERGLEPLADMVAAQELTAGSPEEVAARFVNPEKEVADTAAALAGAGHILAERLSEDAAARQLARQLTWDQGRFTARVASEFVGRITKYENYYDYEEPLKSVPAHRMLAMRRGEKEEVLHLAIVAPEAEIIAGLRQMLIRRRSIFVPLLNEVAEDAYRRLISLSIATELRLLAKKQADAAAIETFASNLRHLLLQPPVGAKRVLGVDPGLRTGSKLTGIDATGKFLQHATIYPHTGKGQVEAARRELLRLIDALVIEMVAVGNGTASREMEQFVKETLAAAGRLDEAVEAYQKVAEEIPQLVEVWQELASLLTQMGRQADAIECYRKALAQPIPKENINTI